MIIKRKNVQHHSWKEVAQGVTAWNRTKQGLIYSNALPSTYQILITTTTTPRPRLNAWRTTTLPVFFSQVNPRSMVDNIETTTSIRSRLDCLIWTQGTSLSTQMPLQVSAINTTNRFRETQQKVESLRGIGLRVRWILALWIPNMEFVIAFKANHCRAYCDEERVWWCGQPPHIILPTPVLILLTGFYYPLLKHISDPKSESTASLHFLLWGVWLYPK